MLQLRVIVIIIPVISAGRSPKVDEPETPMQSVPATPVEIMVASPDHRMLAERTTLSYDVSSIEGVVDPSCCMHTEE